MADENKNELNENQEPSKDAMKEQTNDEIIKPAESNQSDNFVSKKAYTEVSADMHKYKSSNANLKAELNQLKAEKEATDQAEMHEKGQYKELAERAQEKLDQMKEERAKEKENFVDYHKRNEVIKRIGGFLRSEYSNFIQVNSIVMNDDGIIDEISLKNEVDRIKQAYPELIKGSVKPLSNEAPTTYTPAEKEYKDYSKKELNDLMYEHAKKTTVGF